MPTPALINRPAPDRAGHSGRRVSATPSSYKRIVIVATIAATLLVGVPANGNPGSPQGIMTSRDNPTGPGKPF